MRTRIGTKRVVAETQRRIPLSLAEILFELDTSPLTNQWQRLVSILQPRNVVELGTGQGCTSAMIMTVLSQDALLTTIDLPDLDNFVFGQQLDIWEKDGRLTRLIGSTTDEATVLQVPDNIDLLFIDSEHNAKHAHRELELFGPKLIDGALVIIDDLNVNDIMTFWHSLPFREMCVKGHQGFLLWEKEVLL